MLRKSCFGASIWATGGPMSWGVVLFLNPSQTISEEASPLKILLSTLCARRCVFLWEWVVGSTAGLAMGRWAVPCSPWEPVLDAAVSPWVRQASVTWWMTSLSVRGGVSQGLYVCLEGPTAFYLTKWPTSTKVEEIGITSQPDSMGSVGKRRSYLVLKLTWKL